ncbi:MAG: 4-hydroxy-3-methylbut-2-enyl diphosphate reductase [Paludibacteraceae bacterium]|nr:4-hydroxy-3-methylbut-2-enyl diphosphate reductase [Paludibacteraceae bacterium]
MTSLTVTIDTTAGFCFGVTSAIKKAEEELTKGPLYCLGDIVHNGQEVERLAKQGLQTIDHQQLQQLHHTRVLLRAHGEPPSTYLIAQKNDIEIIDASCPVVLNLQRRIRETYEQTKADGGQILIFGKPGHAEVIGLQGQTNNTAIVIENETDLDKVDFSRPIYLFSQTTMSIPAFQQIVATINSKLSTTLNSKLSTTLNSKLSTLNWHDTICRNVANRVENIRKFASEQDIVFFVGGKKSSNAKVLFEHCKAANPNSYFIENENDLATLNLKTTLNSTLSTTLNSTLSTLNYKIGITGATSTPLWLMERIKKEIYDQNNRRLNLRR